MLIVNTDAGVVNASNTCTFVALAVPDIFNPDENTLDQRNVDDPKVLVLVTVGRIFPVVICDDKV